MIHIDCLPMWLATIDARKVKEAIREKLARYQKEAAKVLTMAIRPLWGISGVLSEMVWAEHGQGFAKATHSASPSSL